MFKITFASVLVASTLLAPATASAVDVVVEPITFTVENPLEPGSTYQVNGHRFSAEGQAACANSAVLLHHGLSYGEWAWDFPTVSDTEYSVARALARAGHHAIAIDRLGYGSSVHPNGRLLTVQGYAAMTDQMVDQLFQGAYGQASPVEYVSVTAMGHSAGTEVIEFNAGTFRSADRIIATGYHHFPSDRIVADFVTGDSVRALTHDREYFGADPSQRTEYMYNVEHAEPAVIEADNQLANWTPSGEVHTIGIQPSRYVLAQIDVPVLLVLAEDDLLFPVEFADQAAAMFASAPSVDLQIVPDAGHSFFLHHGAAAANAAMIGWLNGQITPCS